MASFRCLAKASLLLIFAFGMGCARPYSGPKTLAAIGAGLLTVGGTAWVVSDHEGKGGIAAAGMATTALGAVAVLAAGG